MPIDRSAFRAFSYGVYVVCSGSEARRNGQICNTVFQVTSEPPTVAASINKLNFTHEILTEHRNFTVSVLSEEAPMVYIGRFGFRCGRDFDKFEGIRARQGSTGAPIPEDYSVSFIECRVTDSLDCGTHTLFLGEVVDAGVLSDATPMTYAFYHEVKKGKSPSRAPTFIGS